MSFVLAAWAQQQRTGSPTRKSVLVALADRANSDTGLCCPSNELLAEQTELSERTVERACADLVKAGFVARERRRRADGSLGTYEYQFPPVTVSELPDRVTARPPDTVTARNQEENLLTYNPQLPAEADPPIANSDVMLVYDYWRDARDKTRSTYNTISPARRQKIVTRLREFSAEQLMAAIAGVARDPWPDRKLHDDLTIIFRTREQVEKFLELADGGNGRGPARSSAEILSLADRLEAAGDTR